MEALHDQEILGNQVLVDISSSNKKRVKKDDGAAEKLVRANF